MPLDFANFAKRKRPNTARCEICADPTAVDAYLEAVAERDNALAASVTDLGNKDRGKNLDAARKALTAATKTLEDNVAVFTFKALPGLDYENLLDAHPPTDEQLKSARAKGLFCKYNADTFPQALVAASSDDPALDASDVAQIWNDPNWNYAERLQLFTAATEANSSVRIPDLGKGSGPTPT